MRALVTGGTGFIGSNLVLALAEHGHKVVITGHDAEQVLPEFCGKILQPSFIGLDWNAIGQVDVVFHQAAINNTTLLDRNEMMRANVESSKVLFLEMQARGCRRFVYGSSTAVYGAGPVPYRESQLLQPLNPYGESKIALDNFALEFAAANPELVVVGLRYCNVYGPREGHKGKRASMIFQLANQMVNGSPRLFKFGEQKRDYIYVQDVVKANLLAMQAKESCIVNCGSGVATEFNKLISILNKTLGLDRLPEYFDNPYTDRYQVHTECDMSQAKAKLGFMPEYTIESGIEAYYRSGFLVETGASHQREY